jgi:hypothetical protein
MPTKVKNKLNEGHYLPDPKGLKDVTTAKSYYQEINDLVTQAIENAKREALKKVVEKIKNELIDRLICILDENNKQLIVYVSDVVIEKNGNSHNILLIEKDVDDEGSTTERKIKFAYENHRCEVFYMDKYLSFFEENFLNKYIRFYGKPINGGTEALFTKEINLIGVRNERNQDHLIVECTDKTRLYLNHKMPIKLIEPFLKELDPYSEEDWDN